MIGETQILINIFARSIFVCAQSHSLDHQITGEFVVTGLSLNLISRVEIFKYRGLLSVIEIKSNSLVWPKLYYEERSVI